MKISIHIVCFFLGLLVISECSENKKKKREATNWKFNKEILLENISPIGIVAQGNFLWLSDVNNNRIVKIDFDGKIIESFDGFQRPMHIAIQEDKIYVPEYLSDTVKIIEDGTVSILKLKENTDAIAGIAVDGTTVAVADFYNHRIILQEDDKITIIGKEGHNDGELYYPTDVAIKNDLIYVADAYNNRVQVFDFEGNYVKMMAWNEGIKVATGIKVTKTQVIIADFEGNRVLIFDLNGNILQIISGEFNEPTDIEIVGNKMYVVNYKGKTISIFRKQ